ncbi:MAG TPA: TIGR02221 family CRISPR-associated protein [Clostridia bacterium]|nr:TIGR02221 family CRISPR-associated protein [Clostridia bacterium]
MAKILISSLGTGKLKDDNTSKREYSRTVYRFEDVGKEYKTPFIAAALSEHLQVDKLYLVGTSKSMWETVYGYFSDESGQPVDETYWFELVEKVEFFKNGNKKMDEDYLEPVNKAIDGYLRYLRSSASGGSHCYIIDYGLNEAELWNNFDVIMRIGENLKKDDEIYLDITHAFRSIPFFVYLMLDLIGILKFKNDFKLSGLYYGMLDVIEEMGHAPVVDLSSLYHITLWTRGAYNFINYGNGYLLADLIKDTRISENIKNISDIVNINYIDDFKKEIDRLTFLLEDINLSEPVIKYMQPYLMSFTDRFKGISSGGQLQFALAKWYFDNKRFVQGYICLAESIITRILEIYGKVSWDKGNREKIKGLIYNKLRFDSRPEYNQIYEKYEAISETRNLIAHAGFIGQKPQKGGKKSSNKIEQKSYKEDIIKANSYLNDVEKLVFKNRALEKLPDEFSFDLLI